MVMKKITPKFLFKRRDGRTFFVCLEYLGTDYLVRAAGRAEDEEDASDFERQLNGQEEEDIGEEEEDDDGDASGKVDVPAKRKRSDKDDSGGEDDNDGGDNERPSKR